MSRPGLPFMDDLLHAVPELRVVYDQHTRTNGEILPHVLMGDVTRFVLAELTAQDRDVLRRILGRFEEKLASDDADARDLIYTSFIENLLGEELAVRNLKPLMGMNLRSALKTVTGW